MIEDYEDGDYEEEDEMEEVGATKIKDGLFIGDDFSSSVILFINRIN